jgi:hypothetical protein
MYLKLKIKNYKRSLFTEISCMVLLLVIMRYLFLLIYFSDDSDEMIYLGYKV